MKAVKRPGWLYFSMMSTVFSQAEVVHFGSIITLGSFCAACALMASREASSPSLPPLAIMSCQRLTVGSASISGLPACTSLIVPMPSEWSATATQSSARCSLAGWPPEALTSSPIAKRTASSGPSVVPASPASADQPVCTCWSPHSSLSG